MIVGVTMVRNEAGIIETTLRHMLGEGLDQIVVGDDGSTDATREAIWRAGDDYPGQLSVFDTATKGDYWHQPEKMNKLIARAAKEFGDLSFVDPLWIVPFDADEFIYSRDSLRPRVRQVLLDAPNWAKKFAVQVWRQRSWEICERDAEQPTKVVFRWEPGAEVVMGQHAVSTSGIPVAGELGLRELKYRSYEHFREKIARDLDRLSPDLPAIYATHVRRFAGATEADFEAAWREMMAVPTVHDPIPSTLGGLLL